MGRIVKSVSFNIEDPYEKKMMAHAKSFNSFSVYIKRLIQRDMEGAHAPSPVVKTEKVPAEEYDKDLMIGLM